MLDVKSTILLLTLMTGVTLASSSEPARGAPIVEQRDYFSSVTTIDGEPLILKAELNYDNDPNLDPAPIAVVMHGFTPSAGNFGKVRDNAERLRDSGFFVISVAMRGRDGSQGVRDSGGVEIHDIYDAVEHFKLSHAAFADGSNVHITGYSGGGGNVMSALTKFPDYFRLGSSFFGMSDYGLDTQNGWFQHGANGGPNPDPDTHKGILIDDVGDPRLNDPVVTDRYRARASNLASKNNPYSEIHLFVNSSETTSPPSNHISYLECAQENESFPGEFDNIHHHLGDMSCVDFNGNLECELEEVQYWDHGFLDEFSQPAAESWYIEKLRNGLIPQPVLNSEDELYVAGFVKTKPFTLWLGDGQSSAGTLRYSLSSHMKTFSLSLPFNNDDLSSQVCLPNPPPAAPSVNVGVLTVDTSDMAGRIVQVRINNEITEEFFASSEYECELKVGETLRIHPKDTPIGHWKFDEPDGDMANDSGGFQNHGTLVGLSGSPFDFTIGSVIGKIGRALEFDGIDDVIELHTIDDTNPLMLAKSDFTISVWIYQSNGDGDPAQRIIEKSDGPSSANGYSLWIDRGSIGVSVNGDNALKILNPGIYGRWYHLAATMTQNQGHIYINGEPQELILHNPTLPPPGAITTMRIGSRTKQSQPNRAFKGRMDDLRIYDFALGAEEIASLGAPPIAHWKLDETHGTMASDSGDFQNFGVLDGPSGAPFDFDTAGVTGNIGRALEFDGNDDIIVLDEINSTNPLMLANSDFSISVWVYQEMVGTELAQRIVEKSDGPNSTNGYSLWIDLVSIGVSVNGSTALKIRNPGIYGRWFHLAASMTADKGYIYVNGAPRTLIWNHPALPPANAPASMVIGGRADSETRHFQGRLDDLRIYSCALTREQVNRILEEPPVAHWTFDETSGNTAGDVSGQSSHGTLQGLTGAPFDFTIGSVTGKIGRALEFDGDDDVVELGFIDDANPLMLADSAFTISVWVYQQDNGGDPAQRIVEKSDGPSSAHGYSLWIHQGSIGVSVNGENALKIKNPQIYEQWNHIAVTMTADEGFIYFNGEPKNLILHRPALPPADASAPMRFGSRTEETPTTREFRGAMDDLRIYNRSLSPLEIDALYRAGSQ